MGITAVHDIRVTVTDITTDALIPATDIDQTMDVLTDMAMAPMDPIAHVPITDMDPVTVILRMDTVITPIRMAEAIRIIRIPNLITRATGTTIL